MLNDVKSKRERQLNIDTEECLLMDDQVKHCLSEWIGALKLLTASVESLSTFELSKAWTFRGAVSRFNEWCRAIDRALAVVEQKRREFINADDSCRSNMHEFFETIYGDDIEDQRKSAAGSVLSRVEEALTYIPSEALESQSKHVYWLENQVSENDQASKLFALPSWHETKQRLISEYNSVAAVLESFLSRRRGISARYKT